MKPFEKVKIVACFMAHYEDRWIDGLLEDLSKYTNEFYVNLNEPSEKVYKAVTGHPYTKKFIVTKNSDVRKRRGPYRRRWNQALQRENTVRLLDDVKPDIVLFPDADEIYPKCMQQTLKEFWESEHDNLWFHMYYLWGDKTKVRRDKIYKSMCHVRGFKWKEGLTYLPRCGYGALPANLPSKGYKFHCLEPTMHFGYIDEKERLMRFNRDGIDYTDPEVRRKMESELIIKDVPKELL